MADRPHHRLGAKHSAETRAKIAENTRRGMRPWRDGLRVLPSDLRGFMQRGQVAESLRPMVAHATTVSASLGAAWVPFRCSRMPLYAAPCNPRSVTY